MNVFERSYLWLGRRPLLRFVATVFALLPACFLIWFALSSFLAAPAVMVARPILLGWLPGVVDAVQLQGAQMLVLTGFGESGGEVMAAGAAGNQLGYPVNTRAMSYSMAFFAALHFATPQRAGLDRFAWCLVVLWALLAIGLVATTMKNLMLGLSGTFLQVPGVPPADAIALVYQFSTIMVPPLAPVVLWAITARDSDTFRALLPTSLRPAQRSD